MPEIKSCPFCGNSNPKITKKRSGSYKRTGDMFQVLCGKCKARGPIFTAPYLHEGNFGNYRYKVDTSAQSEAKHKAIEAWNKRMPEADNPCGA